MTKREYLDRLLTLTTKSQKDFFDRMYPDGPTNKQLDWAITQVENTLLSLNKTVDGLKDISADFAEYKLETEDKIYNLEVDIDILKGKLKASEFTIDLLTENSGDIQCQLNKLRVLEMAGVDNWEGYDYAMDLYTEIFDDNA